MSTFGQQVRDAISTIFYNIPSAEFLYSYFVLSQAERKLLVRSYTAIMNIDTAQSRRNDSTEIRRITRSTSTEQ